PLLQRSRMTLVARGEREERRRGRLVTYALAVAVFTLVAAAPAAHGVTATLRMVPARTFVTNGSVYAIAPTADAVYIGGDFGRIGPRTGPGVEIDASTGRRIVSPEIAGNQQFLRAVAPDGAGGFYVGGSFASIGGL